MATDIEHIYAEDETGRSTDVEICRHRPASPEAVADVLAQPETDDGRSEFRWFRLQNGTLILGVFPCGDTYFAHENETSF